MAKVSIVEVGMRDGLQNEKMLLNLKERLSMAQLLCDAGVHRLEIGAFVSPKWVPQMADTENLIYKVQGLISRGKINKRTQFASLVPNMIGMEKAIESGIEEISIFTACTETFAKKNINCSIQESIERYKPVIKLAQKNKIKIRGYLSVCFGCPYEGTVKADKVVAMTTQLLDMGAYEVSLGDTIGVATPGPVKILIEKLQKKISLKKIAGHYHDTRGTALANILISYQLGLRTFDTSIGGLGGCPYAPGAGGNVATEDVVYMFEGMGVRTGLDLTKLVQANVWLSQKMQKNLPSKYAMAEILRQRAT